MNKVLNISEVGEMGKWMKFIFVPLIVMLVLALIGAVILAGVFHLRPNGFLYNIYEFAVYFIMIVTAYEVAPNKKIAYAVLYLVFMAIMSMIFQYFDSGYKATITTEIVRILGGAAAILGIWQQDKDQKEARI